MKGSFFAACGLAAFFAVSTPAAHADVINVGTGANSAYLALRFGDGFLAEYQVAFDGSLDGYALTDAADQADADLTLSWSNWGTVEVPSYFLNVASYDDGVTVHTGDDATYDFNAAPENWWHQWVDLAGSGTWVWGNGASVTTIADGDRQGWVFGTVASPTPEPATVSLFALGALVALRRRTH
jgi:hypothetical protein